MCGIAGFLEAGSAAGRAPLEATVQRMTNALEHRGPDYGAVWIDSQAGIALGHRRLSILDLSPLGAQPMRSKCGRYVLIFNGEIYNFRVLKSQLESAGSRFEGHSDTEVMLEAISRWGLDQALTRFNGMFAFALWSVPDRRLILARDRFGEKPLYYGWMGNTFLFGSELKALRQHPAFRGDLDKNAIDWYFRLSYIPSPMSIYKHVKKLAAGSCITIDASRAGEAPPLSKYWSLDEVCGRAAPGGTAASDDEVVEQLDSLLRDSIRIRLESDVPLGAFLSGGVDSSTIVALMQQQTSRPVKTFTIGFEDAPSEAPYARAVAKHLGTHHTEMILGWREALEIVPRLPAMYDEPFADCSQLPTCLVSALARKQVTVSLSGDGGDELFCGYSRYVWAQRLKEASWLPAPVRHALGKLCSAPSANLASQAMNALAALFHGGQRPENPLGAVKRLGELFSARTPGEAYLALTSVFADERALPPSTINNLLSADGAASTDLVRQLMYLDAKVYLTDDILVKLDRASMAVGLEARVPLLDHRIIEFTLNHRQSYDLSGQTKPLLRKVLYRHVPKELIQRPKMGFGAPTRVWFREGWRDWVESLLSGPRLACEEFIDRDSVKKLWVEHLSHKANHEHRLWTVLMLEAWLQTKDSLEPVTPAALCLA